MTNSRVLLLVLCAGLAARSSLAGGPGPDERKLVIGNCSGAACTWDCNGQTNPTCAHAADTCDLPSGDFAARVRFTVDDQVCTGAAGSHFTVALAGQKADGTPFTIPDTTFDFCGLTDQDLACGGTLGLCQGTTIPRSTVFSCTTFLVDGVLDEQAVPDSSWLQFSDFLPAVATALKAQFPGVAGEPFIVSSTDKSFTSDPGAGPSVRDVCITGAFIQPSGPIDVPAAIGSLQSTTSTASLAIGDCPTLPVATTTTTIPNPPFGGDDTGFLPPAKSPLLKCENGVTKAIGALAGALGKCHVARASGKTTDDAGEDGCEQAALTKFTTKTKTVGCGACTDPAAIAAAVEGVVDSNNGQAYCAAGTPFGGDDTGDVPSDAPKGPVTKCESRVAKAMGKLVVAVGKCHMARANGKTTDDVAEDVCESAAKAKFTTTNITGCAGCTDLAAIAAGIESVVDSNNVLAYCQ
jgi:alpha-acetolactate decarboxylase